MKTLELNQMEILEAGGPCDGQILAFGLAALAVAASAGTFNPLGFALATASLSTAIYNLEQCKAANS